MDAYLHRPAEELFDVVNDPEQLVNVAGHPDYRDTLQQMRNNVRQWRAATHDPWLEGQTTPFEQEEVADDISAIRRAAMV